MNIPDHIILLPPQLVREAPGVIEPDPDNQREIIALMTAELIDQIVSEGNPPPLVTSIIGGWDPKASAFVVEWHPDSEKGVQLLGGAYDGMILAVPNIHTNAPSIVRMTQILPAADVDSDREIVVNEIDYQRVGIDPHFDRWVYIYDPE